MKLYFITTLAIIITVGGVCNIAHASIDANESLDISVIHERPWSSNLQLELEQVSTEYWAIRGFHPQPSQWYATRFVNPVIAGTATDKEIRLSITQIRMVTRYYLWWMDGAVLCTYAVHEKGHTVGLYDSDVPGDIMNSKDDNLTVPRMCKIWAKKYDIQRRSN